MGSEHPEDSRLAAIGFMMLAVFFLSTMDAAIKHLVTHYSSLQVTFLRCILSVPLFATWMLLRDRRMFRTTQLGKHVVRGLVGMVVLISIGEAFRELPLADAYALFFAAPLIITALSGPVMKEPAGPVRLSAAAIGFLGVLFILRPGTDALLSYGSIMAMVSVAAYCIVVFLLRSVSREENSITVAFWYTLTAAVVSGGLLLGRWQPLLPEDLLPLAVLALTGTLGQALIVAAYRRASAAVIAPLDYLHMIWAVVYGWLLWGDLPGGRVWVGSAVIVGAGLVILYREHRQGKRAVTTPTVSAEALQASSDPDSRK